MAEMERCFKCLVSNTRRGAMIHNNSCLWRFPNPHFVGVCTADMSSGLTERPGLRANSSAEIGATAALAYRKDLVEEMVYQSGLKDIIPFTGRHSWEIGDIGLAISRNRYDMEEWR